MNCIPYSFMTNEQKISFWSDKFHKETIKTETFIKDSHFYKIALNLSGNREELEDKAAKLINKCGYIKGLKKSVN